jgi:hypothetical protein
MTFNVTFTFGPPSPSPLISLRRNGACIADASAIGRLATSLKSMARIYGSVQYDKDIRCVVDPHLERNMAVDSAKHDAMTGQRPEPVLIPRVYI